MNRNFGTGILILCFGLSSVNAALATQIIDISPIIVEPYDLQELSQQMLAQDRINRDQELAIRGLIDDNQKLTDTALARKQDATLEKINQTMINYRDYLLSRDRTYIAANSQGGRYDDLIALTENVDDMKGVGQTLQLKSDTIEQKYKILTELKDEMTALNEKLKGQVVHKNFVIIPPPQGDKIQMLTQRLGEMDQRISRYNELLAEKDQQIAQLKDNLVKAQSEVAAKDESIRWLNQVVAVVKDKAEYYQLTSQKDILSMKQVQGEVREIRDDFTQHFKNYDQFESAIVSLKNQVGQLGLQLSQKRAQVDLLKSELDNKITQENDQENQISKMKQADDRFKLAKQLIDLQRQETVLLGEKDDLAAAQNAIFERHALDLEDKIKGVLASHQIQTEDLQNRMEELKNELNQKEQQVELLKTELENKITEEKNQNVLADQIQDLNGQLSDKENQIAAMRLEIQSSQGTQAQVDTLKQQLADQQNKADSLKQDLDSKNAQLAKMTSMMGEYQKKLESKDSAYNEQLQQMLLSKNDQSQLEGQIAQLNSRLQEKEAEVIKIKKDMYDLQELTSTKDMDVQTKDLSLSMIQQKVMDDKIKGYEDKINGLQATNDSQMQEVRDLRIELALARQKLNGIPSSDEIDFLRAGLKKATAELNQKDAMLVSIKANADEYAREFKEQSKEFKSLKAQLQDAQEEIERKDEDLKYKNMEVIRLKDRAKLTQKPEATEKSTWGKNQNDAVGEKLKQALDKLDEQGRVINALVQKLQELGQSVNLTQITGKS